MSNDEVLKNYMGNKCHENVMSQKTLKYINKSERERFIIYNINNFLVGLRENLVKGERIDLNKKLDYFPQYSLDEYLTYLRKSDFTIDEEDGNCFISLQKTNSSSVAFFNIKNLENIKQ